MHLSTYELDACSQITLHMQMNIKRFVTPQNSLNAHLGHTQHPECKVLLKSFLIAKTHECRKAAAAEMSHYSDTFVTIKTHIMGCYKKLDTLQMND